VKLWNSFEDRRHDSGRGTSPKASSAPLESREVQALLVVLNVTAGCTDIISFLGRLVLPAGPALLAFDLGFAAARCATALTSLRQAAFRSMCYGRVAWPGFRRQTIPP
jgi:hypothetical protein